MPEEMQNSAVSDNSPYLDGTGLSVGILYPYHIVIRYYHPHTWLHITTKSPVRLITGL